MSFGNFPVELLSAVGGFCNYRVLSSLARVNHQFYYIFNPILYTKDAAEPPNALILPCTKWAVAHESISTLKLALAHGADINAIHDSVPGTFAKKRTTLLHDAVRGFKLAVVRWLLDNGARLDIPSEEECRCSMNLFEQGDAWYPLHYIIRGHDTEPESRGARTKMLQLLLDRGAYYEAEGLPALEWIISVGDPISISWEIDILLQHPSFDPNHKDSYGDNLLTLASFHDDKTSSKLTEKLCRSGVPLNELNSRLGLTTLDTYAYDFMFKSAITLLQNGADPTTGLDSGRYALMDCLSKKYTADITKTPDPTLRKQLTDTRLELLKLLVEGGVKVNRRDDVDVPVCSGPLYWALTDCDDVRCLQLLLDAGANVQDALLLGPDNKSEGLLRGFFDMFAKKRRRDSRQDGNPLTNLNAYKQHVCLLLEHGARIDSVDGEFSALSKACDIEQKEGGLTFLVENATLKNADPKYVEGLKESYREDRHISELLDGFYKKLVAEETTN